jgi:glutamate-5-semialdehyde dehydrogenase
MAEEIARQAHKAATLLKTRTNDVRNAALKAIHDGLRDHKDDVLKANEKDLEVAQQADYSSALIRRLDLGKGDKYDSMLQGILDVAALEDPMGKITLATQLDEGLDLYRVTCPVGVILVIFEARPEVIANISSLAIKSGNAAILKGGKESLHTFTEMAKVINGVLSNPGFQIPPEALQLVSSREQVGDLLHQDKHIDLVIPRGSNELVRSIKSSTKIPVLGHADGLCSIYLHSDADAEMAARIVVDAKTNYPAGCNAVETLLVNEAVVKTVLPAVFDALNLAGVTIKVSEDIKAQLADSNLPLQLATPQDFDTEFLSLTIAAKTVKSVDEAMEHINEHGSHHTDCIITPNEQVAEKFLKGIDSAGVYWNASTRFADGFRYGFGTEVGVSTNKIHARGPMGLEGLMCYQYHLRGHGQVASDYAGAGGDKRFIHDPIDL